MKWRIGGSAAASTTLPNHYRSLIRACARESSLEQGQKLHATFLKNGIAASPDSFLLNALLQLYATCDVPSAAHKVFDEIPKTHMDTIDWTTLMSCYSRNRLPDQALRIFSSMQEQGVYPDEVTFVSFFTACARLGNVIYGTQGHLYMIKRGVPFTVNASNAAMDMYVKCCKIKDARLLFDEMSERSVVSWSILLSGVIGCEGVDNGRRLFDEMPIRNEVAWTVMISGYIENGFTREAFLLISNMMSMSFELNQITLCSFLSACSQSGDVLLGKWVHVFVLKKMKNELHLIVGTTLINMYSKCGRVDAACKVFENMPYKNVVTWNALLSGLAMHGRGTAVLELFSEMVKQVTPDDVTFVSVLSACSHSGLVDQGCRYFHDLAPRYNITPTIEHYACMVDLLGRSGRVEEAEVIVREMPIPPNKVVLGSLLASCGLHGKLHLCKHLLQELNQIDPLNTECHVMLANMYTLSGRKGEADSLRKNLKSRGTAKVPGMSSIHVDGLVHRFSSGDKLHPRTEDIYLKLDEIIKKLRLAGYVPDTTSQVLAVSEYEIDDFNVKEEMEQALFSHSEKLAISFGLLSTRTGSPLHIFKNLRICQDCHTAVKLISDSYNREIIIRDRQRFHRFKNGSCSCYDYW